MISFQHSNQCANFVLLRLRLDKRVVKRLVAQVKKRINVQLIVAVWSALVLNERRSTGIAWNVDRSSIHRQQTIAAKVSAILARSVESLEHVPECLRADLCVAL